MRSGHLLPEVQGAEQLSAPAVLCYGHDDTLACTRQQILGRLGCAAEAVSTATDYSAYLQNRNPSVIVYCQTLSQEEIDAAVRIAVKYRSSARMLVMYERMHPVARCRDCKILESHRGPVAFARTIFQLL